MTEADFHPAITPNVRARMRLDWAMADCAATVNDRALIIELGRYLAGTAAIVSRAMKALEPEALRTKPASASHCLALMLDTLCDELTPDAARLLRRSAEAS